MNILSRSEATIFIKTILLLSCISVFIFTVNNSCYGNQNIIIASGEQGGTYWALGNGLKKILEQQIPNLSINLLPTSGSVENAYLLSHGEAYIAFIQNDIAFYSYHGQEMFSKPNKALRGIASLYPETIHIIVRKDSKIRKIEDLRGESIAVGSRKSGTRFNAKQILEAYHISFNNLNLKFVNFNKAASLLQAKKIDAIFLTAGAPAQSLIKLAKTCNVNLLNIDEKHISKLIKIYPYYVKQTIPANTYYGQSKEVNSIAVKAMLATSKITNPALIYKVTKALFSEKAKSILSKSHPIASKIQIRSALEGMPIYLNAGAKRFYEQRGLIRHSDSSLFSWLLIITCIFLALALATRWLLNFIGIGKFYPIITQWLDRIFIKVKEYKYLFGLLFIFSIMLLDAKVIQYAETRYEMEQPGATIQNYYDTKETLLWLYVLAGSGYNEQRFPETTIGKIAAASLPFIGLSGLITLGGFFMSEKIIAKIQGTRGMRACDCRNHIIICGWNQRVVGIVKGLTDPQALDKKQVIILAPCGENRRIIAEYGLDEKYVGYVNGKASSKEDLYKANIAKAKTALVVADFNNPHSDEVTILSILNIESVSDELMALNKRKQSIYTIAELIHPENRIHLENAKCDEIISTWDIAGKLIIHSVLNHGLSRFITDILTFDESSEIYSLNIKPNSTLIGKCFDEVLCYLRKMDITLLAIQSGEYGGNARNKIITNPSKEEKKYRLQPNDKLILLAESGRAVNKIV